MYLDDDNQQPCQPKLLRGNEEENKTTSCTQEGWCTSWMEIVSPMF